MIAGITIAGPTLEKRISGSPNTALSAAIVRSHSMTNSQPPPMTWPWTEAITGFCMFHGVISNSSCGARCWCALIGSLRQSASARAKASSNWRISSGLIALSLSGRFRVMTLTLSSTAYSTTGSAMAVLLSDRVSSPRLPAREAVDRAEALADAGDDRDAGGAQAYDMRRIDRPGPGVQQVM